VPFALRDFSWSLAGSFAVPAFSRLLAATEPVSRARMRARSARVRRPPCRAPWLEEPLSASLNASSNPRVPVHSLLDGIVGCDSAGQREDAMNRESLSLMVGRVHGPSRRVV
jgi:hypothetical protein